ncbi:MAG TPA: hypothetical protein VKF40_25140 [Burkholderiales bacterium]|nr:hypothetical protein [Burkholderiales bacterium]
MPKRGRKRVARPIKTRRDFESASAIARHLSAQSTQDSAAELRLQSLLKELDKYDDTEEDDEPVDPATEYDTSAPRRRWSDDAPDPDQ